MRISSDTAVHQGLNRDKGGFAGHLPTEGLLSQASDTETPGAGDTEMAKNKSHPQGSICLLPEWGLSLLYEKSTDFSNSGSVPYQLCDLRLSYLTFLSLFP